MTPMALTRTLSALKEWALVCKLLLEGRQAIMLRKGGIDEKGFWVEADEFFLYPTYFHQMAEKVRPEFGSRPCISRSTISEYDAPR